jgi:hypothetical protein
MRIKKNKGIGARPLASSPHPDTAARYARAPEEATGGKANAAVSKKKYLEYK